jgi:hypothetical protein
LGYSYESKTVLSCLSRDRNYFSVSGINKDTEMIITPCVRRALTMEEDLALEQ